MVGELGGVGARGTAVRVTSSLLPTGGIRDADAGKFAIPSTVAGSPIPPLHATASG